MLLRKKAPPQACYKRVTGGVQAKTHVSWGKQQPALHGARVRELLENYLAERRPVIEQIEERWVGQPHRPTAEQVEVWIGAGRK